MRLSIAVFALLIGSMFLAPPVEAQQRGIEMRDGRIVSLGDLDPAALVLLNGEATTREAVAALELDGVESIEVVRGAAALRLYGARAANGVVLITTGDRAQTVQAQGLTLEAGRVMALQDVSAGMLILLDGQPSTLEEIEALGPDMIRLVEVIKGAAARALYGDRAEGGVISVTSTVAPTNR